MGWGGGGGGGGVGTQGRGCSLVDNVRGGS